MGKRRHYTNRSGSSGAARSTSGSVRTVVKKEPVYSEAAKALMAEAERREQERAAQPDKRDFVPKPKAIRRYERYSNMG